MSTRPGRRRARGTGGRTVKIVVTGPFAAGKTTLIRTVSEITVLSTERDVSDSTRARKGETTVAMDFGRITIDSELVLYLFGTPGQDRFDFMWEILGEGMLGYVLLVDGPTAEAAAAAVGIHAAFGRVAAGHPYVVAVNRCDALVPQDESMLRSTLGLAPAVPVVACDATDRESVKRVLLALMHEALDRLESRQPAGV